MCPQKFLVQKNFCLNEFLVQKNFMSKKILGPKQFQVQKMSGYKNVVPPKFWSKGNSVQIVLGPNKFRPPKILSPKSLVRIGSVTALILLPWTWTSSGQMLPEKMCAWHLLKMAPKTYLPRLVKIGAETADIMVL